MNDGETVTEVMRFCTILTSLTAEPAVITSVAVRAASSSGFSLIHREYTPFPSKSDGRSCIHPDSVPSYLMEALESVLHFTGIFSSV